MLPSASTRRKVLHDQYSLKQDFLPESSYIVLHDKLQRAGSGFGDTMGPPHAKG